MSTIALPALLDARSRIRSANLLDIGELCRLLSTAATTIAAYLARGHLLVLDRGDGTLGAACHVTMQPDRSTIDLLIVDPATPEASLPQRMVGVANALCEAYGCAAPLTDDDTHSALQSARSR
jgi:hypothetical protein